MSRHTRSRSAKFLTLAGLTFLSGCSGASSDPATGALFDAGQATAASDATSSKAPRPLAAKHTIDGRVLPVWYPFEDPPMPALLPADGPADGPATGSTQPMSPDAAADSQPTIVLPTDNADTVRRLPPTDGDSAAEPATDRYGVDSRYDLDAAQHGTGEDAHDYPRDYSPDRSVPDRDAEPSPRNELDAPTRQYEPPQSSPLVEPPLASPSAEPPHSNERMQRLPPVEEHSAENHAAENNAIEPNTSPQDHESSTYNRRYAEDALAPPPQPDLSRPSEALADEARPVGRFERLPPVDDTPAASAPVVVTSPSSDAASPLPNYAPATPFVLPPLESGSERSPIVAVHPPRHHEMELINQRAGEAVRQGYELAHRGALYSAQTEFASALRTIAQALDAQETDTKHVQALVAGLTALEESDDFLVPARSVTATVDVAAVVAKHRTPVLKDAVKEDLTPITALQRYYTFAQEQLAAAVEHEPAASQALYGMGKVQTTLQASRTGSLADGPKAIALHQAALLVDERNFMAANELGVLLARCGRYDAARAALAHSVSISPQPAVWRNLAAVHDKLGETTLAANARAASQNAPRTATNAASGPAMQQPVVWLDPAAFAQSAQPQSDLQRGQPAGAPTPAATTVPHTSEKKSGMKWPLW